jgi:hypothetical protein
MRQDGEDHHVGAGVRQVLGELVELVVELQLPQVVLDLDLEAELLKQFLQVVDVVLEE